jgi:4,5-dihydroxyphthalate decarboxylase
MAKLSIALGKYPHTAALRDGSVTPDGIELDFVEIEGPIIGAFRRMVRNLEFDICEMAITTYLSAKEYLKPFTAIPAFPVRAFPHNALVVNDQAGISSPKDLEGRRVGVRAYTVTTGVWARGVLSDVYGVDLDKVTWVIADEEHVKECVLPGNVESIPGADLGAMVASGELAAGIGVTQGAVEGVSPLIKDRAAVEAAWFNDKGIYPINHTVVVKDELLAADPALAGVLYRAFSAAKQPFLDRLAAGGALSEEEQVLADRRALVGDDPVPYGVAANASTLAAISAFAHAQHILSKELAPAEMFASGAED